MMDSGKQMHDLCRELFPICRSITGNGLRESLMILKRYVPDLKIFEVPTGTKCFDWEVPKEWNINDAYIVTPDGDKICDFKKSNLHVVGYSVPIDRLISFDELQEHLHSLPDQPNAIPYVTSYYEEQWGFCISQNQRDMLIPGNYRVVIDSKLENGSLTYGELIIPGESSQEIFLSTYLCHPSMANNELSGPVVTVFIARWINSLKKRRHTYRIIFIPETIGSITYLSRNLESMKKNIVAGFNVTCIGDERAYSYLPSRNQKTLSDKAALHTLKHLHSDFITYSFLVRGSDERQYCAPGIDLPICSIMRSKYGCYPEYHTSLDDLDFVTPKGLFGGYQVLKRSIECLELNETLKATILCEPNLGKRGLYPKLSTKNNPSNARVIINFLTYADGVLSNIEIADIINVPLWDLDKIIAKLKKEGLLELVE
jgi:aminopeptidase-like protein